MPTEKNAAFLPMQQCFKLDRQRVKVKLKGKIEQKYNEKRKIVNIFQNSKWKQEYAIELNNEFEILENMEDVDNIDNNINEKWGKN